MYAKVLAYIQLINHNSSDDDKGRRSGHDVHRKEPRQKEHHTDRGDMRVLLADPGIPDNSRREPPHCKRGAFQSHLRYHRWYNFRMIDKCTWLTSG